MHIYAAQVQAKPGLAGPAADLVTRIRDAAAAATKLTAYGWAIVAGAPIGSYLISARVNGLAELIDAQMKMAADEDYQKVAAEAGNYWSGPSQTNLGEVIATAGKPGDPQPVTVVTRATMAAGHLQEALAWSHEALEYSTKVTGLSGMLILNTADGFYDVQWVMGAQSGAAADEAFAATNADAEYVAMLDRAGGLFLSGSGQRMILARLP